MKTLLITDSDFGATDANFSYLLGFQPTLGAMLCDDQEIAIFLDGRYFEKTKNLDTGKITDIFGDIKISFIKVENSLIHSLMDFLGNGKALQLSDNISLKYFDAIQKSGIDTVIIQSPFSLNRVCKNSEEKTNIKKAISIIDKVFDHIAFLIHSGEILGKTELDIKKIVVEKIYEFGGEGESFGTIVAFGKNSAIPHHHTGRTIISEQGVLLIDCGALYKGYPSDCTRCFWIGLHPSDEYKKVYNIVKAAHELAYRKARIGMKGKEIDAIAREHISSCGYGDYFIHNTGHGVGLNIHEEPFITKISETKLKNDMVFTIEPGIYLPGKFGVRLEDIVYFENNQLKKWTSLDI